MADVESTETDVLLDEELADYQIDDFILQSKMFCEILELFNICPKKVVIDLLDAFGIKDPCTADRFWNDTSTRLKSILKYLMDQHVNITVKDLMDRLDDLNQPVIRLRLRESQNIIWTEINERKRKKDQKDLNNNNSNKNIIIIELSSEKLFKNTKEKCVFLLYVSENATPQLCGIVKSIKDQLTKLKIKTKELGEDLDGRAVFDNNLKCPIIVIMDKNMDTYFDPNLNKDENSKYTKFGQGMYTEYIQNKCCNRRFYRCNLGINSEKYPFINRIKPITNSQKESSIFELDQNAAPKPDQNVTGINNLIEKIKKIHYSQS